MNQRPDPDALLRRVQAEEHTNQRGTLKIFLGAAAGVGKTYTMLLEARVQYAEGVDVVAGYVESHGRPETDALLANLPQLPPLNIVYHGSTLREFDLDGALRRKPRLILVDELAHSNAEGLRHAKRWQDIEELLQAGINVYTTVNIQHLESLNDVVAQITGVLVRETIPDAVLENADDVELVDTPPDELLKRLREGKIYLPQHAERAIQNFFRKGNLIALRELALRRTADRVDAQMQRYMQDHAIATTWPTKERLLVCIGPSPLSARLVRSARRMAARLQAEWIVAYVETPQHSRLSDALRQQVVENVRLAEKLGAQTVTLNGTVIAEELLNYARQRNVSKIVIGKPAEPRWRELLFGSVVDEVIRASGEIDVYVISGEESHNDVPRLRSLQPTSHWQAYFNAILVVVLCSIVSYFSFRTFDNSNLVMLYLLGVTGVAYRYGRGPSIVASLLSVAAFDFLFVQPYLTFAVSDVQYLLTFGVMLTVALIISTLTVRIRAQAEQARQRERRTAALYAMTRELASTRGLVNLLQVATHHISDIFEAQTAVLLPNAARSLQPLVGQDHDFIANVRELATAQWVFDRGQMAGSNTDTLPSSQATYVPLIATRGIVGVLAVHPTNPVRLLNPEQMHLLETFANQTTVAIERANLADEAQSISVQIETERLRNSLLSSVSHDLRTPLASITGAASSLLDHELDPTTQRELIETIADEADWLHRLLSNLLQMTRIEARAITINKEWHVLEELVGAALQRLTRQLATHTVVVDLEPDLPLVPLDALLIEQVLINVIENAVKYSPPASSIEIRAIHHINEIQISVADHGLGFSDETLLHLFDKFFRGAHNGQRGVGLGLAICRGIVLAHNGRIWAANRHDDHGAIVTFTLPIEGTPPAIEREPDDQ